MTAAAIALKLAAQGIRLGINGDRLRVEGPTRLLTEALRAELLAHKAELLAVLRIWELSPDVVFAQAQAYFKGIGYWYELEERAAIREYDGRLSRGEAERQAFTEIRDRYGETQVTVEDADVAKLPLAGIGK